MDDLDDLDDGKVTDDKDNTEDELDELPSGVVDLKKPEAKEVPKKGTPAESAEEKAPS